MLTEPEQLGYLAGTVDTWELASLIGEEAEERGISQFFSDPTQCLRAKSLADPHRLLPLIKSYLNHQPHHAGQKMGAVVHEAVSELCKGSDSYKSDGKTR
jgi:hypothetical protein